MEGDDRGKKGGFTMLSSKSRNFMVCYIIYLRVRCLDMGSILGVTA